MNDLNIDIFLDAWDDLDYPARRKISEKIFLDTLREGNEAQIIEFALDKLYLERETTTV